MALRTPAAHRPGRALRQALAVFRKEGREILRDRRTVIAAVLLPALTMPVVVLAIPLLAQRQQSALHDRPARVAVLRGDLAALLALGEAEGALQPTATADPQAALLAGEVDVVLVDEGRTDAGPRTVAVLYDGTRQASVAAVEKVQRVAARLALQDLDAAARRQGLDAAGLIRLAVDPRDVAPPERAGTALLATALPFFLAVWLLLGGQYAALDVGVGERERGSLEALLATPPRRAALVAGKFLAVLVPALAALGVMLASALLAVAAGGRLLAQGPVRAALPVGVALPLALVGVALGGLLSSAQLVLSLAARTLREAQQAFAGLYLVVALPVMLTPFLGESRPAAWIPFVPVINGILTLRRALAGRTDPGEVAVTCLVLVAATVPVLWAGVRLLQGQGRPIR